MLTPDIIRANSEKFEQVMAASLRLQPPESLQDDARRENIRKNLRLPPLRQDNVERHPVSAVPLERLGDDGVA